MISEPLNESKDGKKAVFEMSYDWNIGRLKGKTLKNKIKTHVGYMYDTDVEKVNFLRGEFRKVSQGQGTFRVRAYCNSFFKTW